MRSSWDALAANSRSRTSISSIRAHSPRKASSRSRTSRGVSSVDEAGSGSGPGMQIEVEVPSPESVEEAIQAGANVILLDNFTVEQTRDAVSRCHGRVPLESSGGITLETIRDYAEAGVDIISVGALTHSPPAADIHLRVTPN